MRTWFIAIFAALAATAGPGLVSPADAGGSSLVAGIFKHECRKANEDKLAFTCGFEHGRPILTLTRTPSPEDNYRRMLLELRFLQAGGDWFTRFSKLSGSRAICRSVRGERNPDANPYSLYCGAVKVSK